jgi:MFS family permease
MLLALFIPLMNGSGYYVLFSYMPTFMNTELNFSKVQGLLVTATSLVAISIAIPYMGSLSDRIGRKKVLAGAAVAMAIAGIPVTCSSAPAASRSPSSAPASWRSSSPATPASSTSCSSNSSPPGCATPPTGSATTSPPPSSAAPLPC